jgi:hypothetical protein
MSHHLDSPTSREDPRLNVTDTYVFDGTRGTVLVMITNTSLAGDAHVPGFHPEARYELKVHTGGEARERRTYRFTFGERDADGVQTVALHELTGDDARSDTAEGRQVAAGATGQVVQGHGDIAVRAWAGRARDPFYLDLHQLSSVVAGLQGEEPITYDGWTPQSARSSFDDSRICAIVLEVDTADPELRAGRDIAVWSVTKLATDAGGWRQINRAAIPMMWPLFRAIGGDDDSRRYAAQTTAHPAEDPALDGDRVREVVSAAAGHTGTGNAHAYADLVATRLLPDVLPYRVGSPASFGFAGFNGRTLADNAPEVMYSLITNRGLPTGLTSAVAAGARSAEFPYVVATST